MSIAKLGLSELIPAEFVKRENRFRAEILVKGIVFKCHVPNSGRMKELLLPGSTVWVRPAQDASRKTPYSLTLVQQGGRYICLNAHMANEIMEDWLLQGVLPEFTGITALAREKTWGNSRFDFQLQRQFEATDKIDWQGQRIRLERTCFLEVKSVNFLVGDTACFPDAPTTRGSKHLLELIACHQAGYDSAVVFLVMGNDAQHFQPNTVTDPYFAQCLQEARAAGVEVYVYRCVIDLAGVRYGGRIAY